MPYRTPPVTEPHPPRDYEAEVSREFAFRIRKRLTARADAWLSAGAFWRRLLARVFRRELASLLYDVHDEAIEDAARVTYSYRIKPCEGQLYMDVALRARWKARTYADGE